NALLSKCILGSFFSNQSQISFSGFSLSEICSLYPNKSFQIRKRNGLISGSGSIVKTNLSFNPLSFFRSTEYNTNGEVILSIGSTRVLVQFIKERTSFN